MEKPELITIFLIKLLLFNKYHILKNYYAYIHFLTRKKLQKASFAQYKRSTKS